MVIIQIPDASLASGDVFCPPATDTFPVRPLPPVKAALSDDD